MSQYLSITQSVSVCGPRTVPITSTAGGLLHQGWLLEQGPSGRYTGPLVLHGLTVGAADEAEQSLEQAGYAGGVMAVLEGASAAATLVPGTPAPLAAVRVGTTAVIDASQSVTVGAAWLVRIPHLSPALAVEARLSSPALS